jgi:hypothetical protein
VGAFDWFAPHSPQNGVEHKAEHDAATQVIVGGAVALLIDSDL